MVAAEDRWVCDMPCIVLTATNSDPEEKRKQLWHPAMGAGPLCRGTNVPIVKN